MQALGSCQLQTEVQAVSDVLPVKMPVIVSLALLRRSLQCKSPLSRTAIVFPSLCPPHALLWSHTDGLGGAHVDPWCVPGHELWWSVCLHCSRILLMCCLNKHEQWLPPPHSTQALPWDRVISESHGQVFSPAVAAQIQYNAVTWSEQGWSIHSTWG